MNSNYGLTRKLNEMLNTNSTIINLLNLFCKYNRNKTKKTDKNKFFKETQHTQRETYTQTLC